MKWSPILHGIAAVTGVMGALTLIIWWIALYRSTGTLFSFSPEHLYLDTLALLLVSIAFGIGALVHQNQEKNKK